MAGSARGVRVLRAVGLGRGRCEACGREGVVAHCVAASEFGIKYVVKLCWRCLAEAAPPPSGGNRINSGRRGSSGRGGASWRQRGR